MAKMKKGVLQLVISLVAFLLSWWGLLWMFSSSSLATLACDGSFSLFHEQAHCRQPPIALMLWVSSGVLSLVFLVFGVRNISAKRETT
ncbi:hypothetical protein [Marinobacter sp. BGYM27]|uniref:hypothetical protein n=1 Tax=Marinobacter sp. BGYM27 TaxID=2975597 RepID=UPI0021A62CF4|nr:hypothetical protein [Marinobacter sp. BGYM27]MDG5499366.1 hypothetical protein [Marinobacter sp. BGYM27]